MVKTIPGDSKRQVSTVTDVLAQLRDFEAAAVAATSSEAGLQLLPSDDSSCKAVIKYPAYTGYVAATNFWTVSVEAATAMGGPWTAIGEIALDAGPGTREIAYTGAQVDAVVPGAEYLRCTATLTGAAGALTYGVDVIPVMVM